MEKSFKTYLVSLHNNIALSNLETFDAFFQHNLWVVKHHFITSRDI